jgi:hypothetical protein
LVVSYFQVVAEMAASVDCLWKDELISRLISSELSAYLHLDYEFQLINVDINRFILTLDTHMPPNRPSPRLYHAQALEIMLQR